jgi:hypothetical protein
MSTACSRFEVDAMPTIELLEPNRHAHLRLRERAADDAHFVQIVAGEFASAASCCPILFTKDASDGAFYAGAMYGFKPGENLLGDAVERSVFEPLMLRRDGFFISDRSIAIDRDNARFSESEGELLFDDGRQPADALRAIQRTLGELHHGIEQTKAFIAALLELKLIESIEISLSFDNGERLTLQGLYTVSLDKLRELDDAAVVGLFRAGHLHLAITMANSLRQIARLAKLRNRRLALLAQ